MMKYKICYILYNCENTIYFRELSQYTNWTYVMEKEFKKQFKIVDIFDLNHERRKRHNEQSN